MRRLACVLAAVLLIAPAGLRLAASSLDSDALRCAIACSHAGRMAPGAACCPMADSSKGLGTAMTSCDQGDSPTPTPVPASHPAILLAVSPLASPEGGSPLFALAFQSPRGPSVRPPDHVPLLLS